MAKTADMIFCLDTEKDPIQGVVAKTILTVIELETIPGSLSFSNIITILDVDTSIEHHIVIQIKETEEVLAKAEINTPVLPILVDLPEEYRGINIAIDWKNINFTNTGVYSLCVYFDEDLIGTRNVFVKEVIKNEA